MQALRLSAVSEKVGLCPSYIYRLIERGDFPKPAKYGRVILFSSAEVDTWLEARFAERDAGEVAA